MVRNRVRERRLAKGLLQADVAAALGVSRQTVISIENGRYSPSLPLAFRLARFFDTPLEELFELDEDVEVRG
jgi:putative transcriptional regulator